MLTEFQTDALKEIINIGIGRAGSLLSELIGASVGLHAPSVMMCEAGEIGEFIGAADGDDISFVSQKFSGSLFGNGILVFPRESATALTQELIGDEIAGDELEAEREGALIEVGNIVLNSVMGSISKILAQRFDFSLPVFTEGKVGQLLQNTANETGEPESPVCILCANANFDIEEFEVRGTVLLLFEVSSFQSLIATVEDHLSEQIPD